MPELDHVRGILNHEDLPGPPNDPTPRIITDEDKIIGPPGDPDATSKRYFIETKSPELADIVERIDDEDA